MKQLTCEMCGSTELLKQDGVFVCQTCGTKYSVEEAKKMMVEGKVDVTGSTVKVDSSERLNNLYTIARRAKDDNNSEKAAQYYDMILQEDPMSWEATFYTTYYSAMQTNIAGIESAAIKVNNCIDTVLKLIRDNVPKEEQIGAVLEINTRVIIISSMLYNAAKNHYEDIDLSIRNKYTNEYIDRIFASQEILYNLGNQIEKIFEDSLDICTLAVLPWKDAIEKDKIFVKKYGNTSAMKSNINFYIEKIGKYDQDYKTKYEKEVARKKKNDKISKTKNRINEINKIISATNTTGDYKFNGCGTFFLVCAFIMLILGIAVSAMSGFGEIWWAFLAAAVEIIIGIFVGIAGKPTAKQIEANIEKVKKLKAEKEELEKKLAELEQEDKD